MTFALAALGLWGAVARAQEPGADAPLPPPPPDAPLPPPSAEQLAAEVAALLGEDPLGGPPLPPPPAPTAANAFNPRITAFGDLMTTVGVDDMGVMPGSGPWLRSFELDLRADVDPFAKAVAVIALEQEPPELDPPPETEAEAEEEGHGHGAFAIAPEELYIDLVSLPAGFSARIGQFKLPFGLTNKMHPHDWAWPDAPMPFAAVLGEEGMAEMAAVASWHVPNPWKKALTLEGGVTGGDAFDAHGESPVPGFIGRAEYFDDFGQVELGVGVSTAGQTASRSDGADLMFRWRKDAWHSVVLMGEAFRAVEANEAGPIGVTGTLQVQPTRPLYLGARVDQMDGVWQYAAFASFYTSEFLRVRAGASTDLSTWIATGQLTFVWGSHPVEPYWVNR